MRGAGKSGRILAAGSCLALVSFLAGAASKFIKPAWGKKYSVRMSKEIGKVYRDLSYGEGEANKFDLYVPVKAGREAYGLAVYLHAGGFTSGDKKDDEEILACLCQKGYVAAGINYTLKTDKNDRSVYSQSLEIRAAVPKVIEAAESRGYPICQMAVGGGSAGGTLAMLYAYRDGKEAPVPVRLLFEAVGPSGFCREDWGMYGLDRDTKESRRAAAGLFGVMAGTKIDEDILDTPQYDEIVKPISAYRWVKENPVPSILAYGVHDKVQPYQGALRLERELRESGADYRMFTAKHSGHGLQNDGRVWKEYMEAVEEYLEKYMPAERKALKVLT